jgi:ABC-type lipoprotein release transport system permease subunit
MTMVARLAWRSVWRHRRRTLVTIASIGLGLAVAVFSMTLAEGMYRQLVDDAARMQAGHVTLEPTGYRDTPAVDVRLTGVATLRARVAAVDGVAATKPLVLGQGIAHSADGAAGVSVLGVEPAIEARTSPLARRVVAGTWLPDDPASPTAMVGALLAERLDLEPGKKLVLTTNDVAGDLTEVLVRVAGVFRTGAEEIDGYLLVLPIGTSQRVYGLAPDEATQLGVVLHDPTAVERARAAIRAAVPDPAVAVLRWQEVLPELAAFIRLDRVSDRTFQGLLLVLILFTIFNTVLMSVLERTREFAVQLALGTAPGQLRLQLLGEATVLGALGCAVGLAIGGAAAGIVQARGLDLRRLYAEGLTISGFAVDTVVHAHVTARLLLVLGGVVFGATLLSSLPAMRRAVRVPVPTVLR